MDSKPYISLSFSIHYRTCPGRTIYVCGNIPEFGLWNPYTSFPLKWSPNHQWTGTIKITPSTNSFQAHYKFLEASNDFSFMRWEEISDRFLNLLEFDHSLLLVLGEVWEFPKLTKRLVSIPLDLKSCRESEKLLQPEKDVRQLYNEMLGDHALGSMKMEQHFYSSFFQGKGFAAGENSRKVRRLTNEIKLMQNYLPVEFSNAIFLKYDEQRMDVMKTILTGVDDTPYANGVFLFDVFFDENYPNYPPKVTLMTTGGGKVRFNPNLYNNGYVCLSLLGTWSGDAGEKWREESNFLQVLISLQSIVMTDGILYNEPAYANGRHNKGYAAMDLGYTNIVKYGNVKYAMNQMLENPPKGFEEIIKLHFYLKKEAIMKECMKWLTEAEIFKNDSSSNVDYMGLVSSHNFDLATTFAKEKSAYYNLLNEEIEILKKNLETIKI